MQTLAPFNDATGVAYSEFLLHPSTSPNFRRYGGPFTLAGNPYSIDFRSRDNAGNLETSKTEFFRVDAAAPVSQLFFISTPGSQGVPEVSTTTVFQLNAVDPVVNNVSSGLKDRWLRIDGGAFAPSTGTFTLSAGSNTFRTLYFFSRDHVLNREVIKSTTVFVRVSSGPVGSVDTVPPLTQLIFSTAPYTNPYGYRFVSTSTILRLLAVDPQPNASGVAFSEYRISPATSSAFTRYASTFTLTGGSRRVDYRSQDASGNLEAIRSDGLRVDGAAPISSLSFASPQISSTTAIQVNAVDPVVDNVASGVKDRWVMIDSGPFVLSTGTFFIRSPNSGLHTISYFSRDNVLNQDVVRSSIVFVTGTTVVQPSSATLLGPIGGPIGQPGTGGGGVSCMGDITSGQPLVPHGVVTAVRNGNFLTIDVTLQNGDPNTTYSIEVYEAATFCYTLDNTTSTGVKLISDSAGNGHAQAILTLPRFTSGYEIIGDGKGLERIVVILDTSPVPFNSSNRFAAATISFAPTLPDTTPPVTQFSFSTAPYINSYGTRFISSSTLITLTATDTPARPGDVFWGLAKTEYRIRPSGNPNFQNYVTPFALPGNGSWGVDFQSLDKGGNQEVGSTITVRVDAVPPISQLVLPSTTVTPSTPLQLLATDPNVNNVTSGVKDRWVQIDAGGFTPVTGNFFIPASTSGFHTIHYYSRDNVLNREVVRSTSVFVQTGLSGLSALTAPARAKTISASQSNSGALAPAAATPESLTTAQPSAFGVRARANSLTDFELRKTFVFPNPARGGAAPVIHTEVGQADEVTIRIYDTAGRQLQEVTLTQISGVIDSGAGPELAYEYTWDGDHPSGVYFYSIKAKKAGAEDIDAKGKFAIIR